MYQPCTVISISAARYQAIRHEGSMNDPIPAITEAAATGEIAAIFADIRHVLGVDVVNLVWRHLATIDGALPWAWGTLRPLYIDGSVIHEATTLHAELALPSTPSIPAEVFAGLGLRQDDLTAIRSVLAAYDHTNAMALVALSALRARLQGSLPSGSEAAEPMPVVAAPQARLPRLLNLTDLSPSTAALVTTLNGLGTRRTGSAPGVRGRYWPACIAISRTGRPICHWPGCC
jgi:hypothetical protein